MLVMSALCCVWCCGWFGAVVFVVAAGQTERPRIPDVGFRGLEGDRCLELRRVVYRSGTV